MSTPLRRPLIIGEMTHPLPYPAVRILACHPARSTKRLDWVAVWCERWRIRTGPISILSMGVIAKFDRNPVNKIRCWGGGGLAKKKLKR